MQELAEFLATANDTAARISTLANFLKIDQLKCEIKSLEKSMADPKFWDDQVTDPDHLLVLYH